MIDSIHISNAILIAIFAIMGFSMSLAIYPKFIAFIKSYKLTQKIRDEAWTGGRAKLFQALHAHKSGTPTMGGVVIIGSVILTVLLSRIFSYFGWIDSSLLSRGETYLPLFTLGAVGALGMVDDYLNITERNKQKGLPAKVKFWSLFVFAVVAALWFVFKLEYSTVFIPGFGFLSLGLWYAPLFVFILLGVSNAVNITDGLDGLAGGLTMIAFGVFGALAYLYGLPLLAALCTVIVAALGAFLWYNVSPAKIYMGDTGSLALGATLAVIAMMTNALILLAIVGIVFVVEACSSLLQMIWKRKFKKKLFLIAPIHHHFEAKGWSETQIVMRFWLLGIGAGIVGFVVGVLSIDALRVF